MLLKQKGSARGNSVGIKQGRSLSSEQSKPGDLQFAFQSPQNKRGQPIKRAQGTAGLSVQRVTGVRQRPGSIIHEREHRSPPKKPQRPSRGLYQQSDFPFFAVWERCCHSSFAMLRERIRCYPREREREREGSFLSLSLRPWERIPHIAHSVHLALGSGTTHSCPTAVGRKPFSTIQSSNSASWVVSD